MKELITKYLNVELGLDGQEIIKTKLYQALDSATTTEIKESLDAIGDLSFQRSASSLWSASAIKLRFDVVQALVQKLSDDDIASISDNTMQSLFKLSLIACDSGPDAKYSNNFLFLEKLYDRYKDKIDNKFKDYHIALIHENQVHLPFFQEGGLLYSKNILCNLAKLSGTSMSSIRSIKLYNDDDDLLYQLDPTKIQKFVSNHDNKKLLIILNGHGIGDVHEMLGEKTTVWVNSFLEAINAAKLTHPAELLLQSCYASNAVKNLKDDGHKTANAKVAALADAPILFVDGFDTILKMFLDPEITDFNIDNFLKFYNSCIKARIESNPDLAMDDPDSVAKVYNPASIDCTTGEYWSEITKGMTLTSQEGKEEITEMNLLGTDDNGHADIDFS